jgi:hypothetical protein
MDIEFSTMEYTPVYNQHVQCLQAFEKHPESAKYQLLDKIRAKLHNTGRYGFHTMFDTKVLSLNPY